MNLKEAYQTLEIPEGSTEAEAKKKYKKLAAQWHPDVNKAPDAEAKFKKINEAMQRITKGEDDPPPQMAPQRGGGFWSPFGRQQQHRVIQLENVEVEINIDFKESVIGCKREVKYSRRAKCPTCNGEGETNIDNGCKKCGGKGRITSQQRGMIFITDCPVCHNQAATEDCKACKGDGALYTDVSVHVSVPAGVSDGNVLRLQGMGHYAGSMMGMMDQFTDAYCHVHVKPEAGLTIEGKSVVSNLDISLLDAIRGCKRNVKTIFGNREIRIPARSRHNDEVIIPHCGVGGTGDQRVLLNVEYPKNTDKLVGVLIDEVV